MAFKSEAQRKKLHELHLKGKISKEVFEGMTRDTGNKKLPHRVEPKEKPQKAIANKAFTAKIFK